MLGDNGLIEYYLPEDGERYPAWLDEITSIDENDVPIERKQEYDELYRQLGY